MEINNAKMEKVRTNYYLSVEINGSRKNIKKYGTKAPDAEAVEDDYLMYVQGFADATKALGTIMNGIKFSADVDTSSATTLAFTAPMSHVDAAALRVAPKAKAQPATKPEPKKSPVGESGRSLFSFTKGSC